MNAFERVSQLSPLPIADLTTPTPIPEDGLMVNLSETCRKNIASGQCSDHYNRLKTTKAGIIQCPFGFSSMVVKSGSLHAAITGFVPFPRSGGPQERIVSKRHPATHI